MKIIRDLGKHESCHSTLSRVLRSWVQEAMNTRWARSPTPKSLQPIYLSSHICRPAKRAGRFLPMPWWMPGLCGDLATCPSIFSKLVPQGSNADAELFRRVSSILPHSCQGLKNQLAFHFPQRSVSRRLWRGGNWSGRHLLSTGLHQQVARKDRFLPG